MCVRGYLASQYKSASQKWEILKKRIKSAAIEFSRNLASEDAVVIANLSEKLNEYESSLPLNREENILMENTRVELEEKTMERVKGIMFRSKAKWYEEGEKNTKYFLSLEKAKYNAKTCYKLITEAGEELVAPTAILQEQREFYQKLYEEDKDVKFSLNNTTQVRVPETIRKEQDKQLDMTDFEQAIKGMKNKKTPGEDGLPVDFYKVFWNRIKPLFLEMAKEGFEKGTLHSTARQGILNLIPKANKDTRYVKNLRPITLLNTDYKIIEKAIANKMLPALEHIIHKDQRGFMKNRRISVNIRKMLDIIHQAEQDDLEAVVLSLDFVKCFDKCSFSILHGSLDFFGFGKIVKEWTHILYTDFTVKIQNNGYFSEKIKIKKGVHQGGCCSSLYFLVIAEILAIALRENENIDGITLSDIRNLLNQFADDMDIFSLCNEKSIKAIFEELDNFRKQSGFTVSYEKTTLYRIGSLRHSDAQMYNMSSCVWSNRDITVLGVVVAHEDIMEKNYNTIIEKAKSNLKAWYNRGLSLIGKIQVVNTMVASLFVYKMMVLPIIPTHIIRNMENIIRDYIWDGKKSKIALGILQLPKQEGGLNLVDLKKKDISLKATWPRILHEEVEYEKLVYTQLRCSKIGRNIWRCTIHPDDVTKMKIRNNFWKDTLWCWSHYNYYKNLREDNQIIWNNSHIKVAGKMCMWNDIYLRGLVYVHQLFKDQDFKSDQEVFNEFGLGTLRYNSLKMAIPEKWKTFFRETPKSVFFPIRPHEYDQCIQVEDLSSRIYKYIAEDVVQIHYKFLKWKQELGDDFMDVLEDFKQAHLDIYKVTNVPKLRSFQYRLLQRGLVTNILLEKWQIIPSRYCTFCKQEPETVEHLFVSCPEVRRLWSDLIQYLNGKYNINLKQPGAREIILNKLTEHPKNHVVNFICLITKQFIYRQRCCKEQIHINAVVCAVNKVENIEKYIASKNGKLKMHMRKWQKNVSSNNNVESVDEFLYRYIENM